MPDDVAHWIRDLSGRQGSMLFIGQYSIIYLLR
jgi:hypothetical protein